MIVKVSSPAGVLLVSRVGPVVIMLLLQKGVKDQGMVVLLVSRVGLVIMLLLQKGVKDQGMVGIKRVLGVQGKLAI